MARVRHLFNWSIAEGMIDRSPFKRGDVTLVPLDTHAERERTRRLQPGERQRLLKHAGPHLQALIIAALSTGCRRGELLSLQWSQIQRDEQGDTQVIVLPASKPRRTTSASSRCRPSYVPCWRCAGPIPRDNHCRRTPMYSAMPLETH